MAHEEPEQQSDFAYVLRGAGLRGPPGKVADGLDWEIASTGVTALLGPSGTGKSTLLKALAGHLDPEVWQHWGRWTLRGQEFGPTGRVPLDAVHFFAQPCRRRGSRRSSTPDRFGALNELPPTHVLLLDEPDRWVAQTERETLAGRLRRRGSLGAVVLITHDLSFARQVADDVILFAGGRTIDHRQADQFFDHPTSPLVSRFLRDGNLWPNGPSPPPLPGHFHWVLPGKLGGMAWPGYLGGEEEELEAIAHAGITALVSLTPQPFPRETLRRFGIEGLHLPITDMQAPAVRTAAATCSRVARVMENGGAVAFHCRAGLGRTGLMLASVLVWLGRSADRAIQEVRSVCPGYIQSAGQVQFVHAFSTSVVPAPAPSDSASS